ncbi:MAG: SDR family oxidoreductase [Cyclobacteriaceae bacterium]|nr:SDR family oxidoreductase [Cyclobacteriaceae bacterium HetDA_MAG_MS6]
MKTSLIDKIALVTGGSRSLGKEVALQLAKDGADVIITYKNQKTAAESVVEEIKAMGRKSASVQVDLNGTRELPKLEEEIQKILSNWGQEKFDILINNAGVISNKPLHILSEEDLDNQYNTNYKSVVFLTQRLLNHLSDGGRVINIGSGTTRFAFQPLVGYGPIKAAVEVFTMYLAKILGERKITANVVSPGALDTDFNAEIFSNPDVTGYVASQTALGRVGLPTDVSGVISFLSSEAGGWINGQRIEVSGGYHL